MSGYDVAVGRLPQKVKLLLPIAATLPLFILCTLPAGAQSRIQISFFLSTAFFQYKKEMPKKVIDFM